MPSFDIVREIKTPTGFRANSIVGKFDLTLNNYQEKFKGNIDLPKDWKIGLIVGNSGTGKTTIAREIFGENYFNGFEYSGETIMDDMPKEKSVDEICKIFNSVGFSSPPSWLKPYHVLSNGEKMRVDLARCILEDQDRIVFDEFTSVVDRTVAKIGSLAISKSIQKTNKQFIAVTCHHDVEAWLQPDWVFDTDSMVFFCAHDNKGHNLKSKYEKLKGSGNYLGNIII
jgi:ABC-type ATPase with predicted acetyltransferase domain